MIIHRPTPDTGICFAWTPKWTPDGTVWLEHVHYRRTDDGYDTHPWRYERWIPQDRYDAGERAFTPKAVRPCTCPDNLGRHEDACRFNPHPGAQAKFFNTSRLPLAFPTARRINQDRDGYSTPPNISKCAERNTNDPCYYPHCTCMNLGGSTCPA